MYNLFPIQFLAPLAYMLLRCAVGVLFLWMGSVHFTHRKSLSSISTTSILSSRPFFVWCMFLLEIGIGIFFILGFLTQIVAILSFLFSLSILLMHKQIVHQYIPPRIFYVLILFVSISLFITGAGIFAFDLPI